MIACGRVRNGVIVPDESARLAEGQEVAVLAVAPGPSPGPVPAWLERLLTKLERLRQADPEFLVHGASGHWYRLGPRLTPGWVAWLEAKYGIELPEQYRDYLLHAGNGGAGPHHGLQRFGYLADPSQAPVAFSTGAMIYTTHPSGLRRGHPEMYTPAGAPTDGFDVNYFDSMRMLADSAGILAEPFPFIEAKYSNSEVLERLGDERLALAGAGRWFVPGALDLCDYGCGIRQMLVLNGPRQGEVWTNDLANDAGFSLEAENFEAWYDRWLDEALQFCARSLNYRRLLSLFATSDPAEARAVEALLRARGIRCEVEGEPPRTVVVLVDKDGADEAQPLIAEFSEARKKS
jgi:hypothetical protein